MSDFLVSPKKQYKSRSYSAQIKHFIPKFCFMPFSLGWIKYKWKKVRKVMVSFCIKRIIEFGVSHFLPCNTYKLRSFSQRLWYWGRRNVVRLWLWSYCHYIWGLFLQLCLLNEMRAAKYPWCHLPCNNLPCNILLTHI